ncbi:eukaryotic translation initiation factor 3 subunit E-like [Pistacia vera]|uniref:eukaryotic translation initiation factor 3 subunit E-like n=1 Tax=Pistacia vera TaxID=55513 RepID=UPI0012636CCA|nr:eukaryotic translation initiation factor 3 subunit E-like [Pistacia vera]
MLDNSEGGKQKQEQEKELKEEQKNDHRGDDIYRYNDRENLEKLISKKDDHRGDDTGGCGERKSEQKLPLSHMPKYAKFLKEILTHKRKIEEHKKVDLTCEIYLSSLVPFDQIGPDQIEALYQYAKFQFECGNYSGAADYLYQYRALCTNSERRLSALWGKLAAEILMQNWDIALEELNQLKEKVDDSKSFTSPLSQMQSRIWLMHWSLFIFFNHDNGRTQIIDLFNQDKYLNAIQTNAPHLLRYLATAFIVNKRRRPQFKDFIKVIQQEQYSYKDPITEFLACVYVNYDFDGAQKKMRECEEVILNDPFLGKRLEEGNFSTVPLRDEFLENARLFIFETYCRIHQRIDMGVLAEKLNLNYEEAERWIVNLIRNSKLDAKIDTKTGTVIMEPSHPNVYEQLIDHTKALSGRTYKLVSQLMEHAQTQAAR